MSPAEPACLADTNVLLRFADASDRLHGAARHAVGTLRRQPGLRVASQNLVECWNVMTRPRERNGFGQTVAEADVHLRLIERLFPRLPELPDTYDRWRELVARFEVSGVQVHDARLVATMLSHGLSRILTFNTRDFVRYTKVGIEAVSPETI